VVGALTSPANGGAGYVGEKALESTLSRLVGKYPDLAGAAGWEYFNSSPGGTAAPWEWAARVAAALSKRQ
jgi:hypothetical protein